MSGFFPFNLNMRVSSGDSVPSTTPTTGCPLTNHPAWRRVVGVGDSVFCWENQNGTTISIHGDTDNVKNLSFNSLHAPNGFVGCTIEYIGSGSQNWLLPLAGRMINGSNIVGARWNDGKFEVVQRKNNFWSTIGSGGTPVVGDEVVFSIFSTSWRLTVNGVKVLSGNLGLAELDGYWGMSQHRSGTLNGQTILSNFHAGIIDSLEHVVYNGEGVTYNGEEILYMGE